MKTITVANHEYKIFFRYLSKYGKLPHFRKKAPFQAITICTIQSDDGKFTAQDLAVCSEHVAPKPTPAMREALRQLALAHAHLAELLRIYGREKLGMLADNSDMLVHIQRAMALAEAELHPDQYSRREGRLRSLAKTLDRCGRLRKIKMEFLEAYLALDPRPLSPERLVLSDQRKEELLASGQEGKVERRLQRKQNKNKKGVAASSPAGSEMQERGEGGNG